MLTSSSRMPFAIGRSVSVSTDPVSFPESICVQLRANSPPLLATESEDNQDWTDIYRNDNDEVVAEIHKDPSAFAAGVQNVGRFSHSEIISHYFGNLTSLTDLRDPNPSPYHP